MTERWILVDADVFAELQKRAEPLVDDANSVLRRGLGLTPDGSETVEGQRASLSEGKPAIRKGRVMTRKNPDVSVTARQASRVTPTASTARAPRGSLLPEADYVLPLLTALVELGGSAPTSQVVDSVGLKLDRKLTDTDRKLIKSGDVRWKNRLQFVRIGLIKQGLMATNSPRGIWEISETGHDFVTTSKEASE